MNKGKGVTVETCTLHMPMLNVGPCSNYAGRPALHDTLHGVCIVSALSLSWYSKLCHSKLCHCTSMGTTQVVMLRMCIAPIRRQQSRWHGSTGTVYYLFSGQATYADGVAKDEMRHHGIADKDHATHQAEMDEIWASQGKGAGDHPQAGLEVHSLQHPPNQQQDVDAIQGVVPCQLVYQVLHLQRTGG